MPAEIAQGYSVHPDNVVMPLARPEQAMAARAVGVGGRPGTLGGASAATSSGGMAQPYAKAMAPQPYRATQPALAPAMPYAQQQPSYGVQQMQPSPFAGGGAQAYGSERGAALAPPAPPAAAQFLPKSPAKSAVAGDDEDDEYGDEDFDDDFEEDDDTEGADTGPTAAAAKQLAPAPPAPPAQQPQRQQSQAQDDGAGDDDGASGDLEEGAGARAVNSNQNDYARNGYASRDGRAERPHAASSAAAVEPEPAEIMVAAPEVRFGPVAPKAQQPPVGAGTGSGGGYGAANGNGAYGDSAGMTSWRDGGGVAPFSPTSNGSGGDYGGGASGQGAEIRGVGEYVSSGLPAGIGGLASSSAAGIGSGGYAKSHRTLVAPEKHLESRRARLARAKVLMPHLRLREEEPALALLDIAPVSQHDLQRRLAGSAFRSVRVGTSDAKAAEGTQTEPPDVRDARVQWPDDAGTATDTQQVEVNLANAAAAEAEGKGGGEGEGEGGGSAAAVARTAARLVADSLRAGAGAQVTLLLPPLQLLLQPLLPPLLLLLLPLLLLPLLLPLLLLLLLHYYYYYYDYYYHYDYYD
ncbi:hypothetical protein T492DRAFT_549064 [Pavlovales sp. CCMP2436]|nr:hypothetical protein T492DRAFT_549064 [Pavlovales sp. CCMP2436]